MEDKIDEQDVDLEKPNEEEAPEEAKTEEKQKADKPKRTPEEELEYFEGRAKRLRKELGIQSDKKEEQPSSKTGDIDSGQKAYLRTVLGIKGPAELALVREYVGLGKSIEDLEDNRHFMNDLKDLREAADTKTATPSSTRRSGGGGGNDLDLAIAEYEQTQKLPKDFKLRQQVVEAMERKHSDNTPPWLR